MKLPEEKPDIQPQVSGPTEAQPPTGDKGSFFDKDCRPVWKHDQKVTSDKARALLMLIKERMEGVIKSERERLVHLTGVRDSVRKP